MTTIYEVADRAGVSASTVSRVLNSGRNNSEKARRVHRAARELNYVPSKAARRLRRPSSELIALMIPDISNPFFTALARGVEDTAQKMGYSVVLCNTDDDSEKETRYIEVAIAEEMAGVILAPGSSEGNVAALLQRKIPTVAVDRRTGTDVDVVTFDNEEAARLAMQNLFDHGYQRIGCIAGPDGEINDERARTWKQMIRDRGQPNLDELLVHADYRVRGGEEAMQQLLAQTSGLEAVLVTNNLMGVGALRALAAKGIDPHEFGVAVIGELPFLIHHEEEIFQLELPAQDIGATAAELLLDRIGGDTSRSRVIEFRPDGV